MTDSATVHFQNAWKAFTTYPRIFVISMLTLFGSWVVLEVAVISLQRFGLVVWLFLHIAFFIFFSGLILGFHRIALDTANGESPELAKLFAFLGRGPTFFLAFCIYSAVVFAGLVLLVVPGIYVAVKYALFGQVLATTTMTAPQALRAAAMLTEGRWWTLFLLLLMAMLLNLVGTAFLGVGLLITFPISLLAASDFFRSRRQTAQQ